MTFQGQREWHDLYHSLGPGAARREAARQLRMLADIIEAPGYPDVFAAELLPVGADAIPGLIDSVSVTLSHPWPG